jgi:hypothetical protein
MLGEMTESCAKQPRLRQIDFDNTTSTTNSPLRFPFSYSEAQRLVDAFHVVISYLA